MPTNDVACDIVEKTSSAKFNTLSTEYYARVPVQGEYVEYTNDGTTHIDRVINVIHTDQSTEKAKLVVRQPQPRH